ncbi:hypothetical protein [Formosa sp. PL04]|uniref:hypothetical protein n=1 Tax=Formosa sp. PL04 TaxID=3081755 RepID=UPI002981EBC0|nr:hypothetical protein [Formosa sp. PL04]MDW5290323.1 hypothetical protein [Formosa sp. PL04]
MKSLTNLFKSAVQACPYTHVGKTCISAMKGEYKPVKNSTNKILAYKSRMRTGRNISLVGVFCPFLWYAIISGASTNFILLNAMHSGIIVAIGLLIIAINYFYLIYSTGKQ